MSASIILTKGVLSAEELGWVEDAQGYPLEVTAVGQGGIDSNIFVFQLSGTGLDPNQGDIFIKVADVLDLSELPTEDNIDSNNFTFYRTDSIKIFCRTKESYEKLWKNIKEDVKSLLNAYNMQPSGSETVEIN